MSNTHIPERTCIICKKKKEKSKLFRLAKLKEKAPQTYIYLKQRLLEEFQFNNDTGEIISNKPQQLSLFDNIESNEKLWEEIKDKWIESGRTEADFNSMSNEEREHIIENCL